MKRFTNAAFAAAFALACCLIATGCDRDNATTEPTASDTDRADSSLVRATVGDRMLEAPFQTLELSAKLLAAVPGSSPVSRMLGQTGSQDISQGDDLIITSVLTYRYADGWHVFTFEAIAVNHATADTVDITGTDSVRVLVDGSPVPTVSDSTSIEAVLARAHLDWANRRGVGEGALHHSLDVAVLPMEFDTLVTIDGFAHDSLSGIERTDSATCALDLSYDLTIDNLQVRVPETAGDCPESGDLAVSVGIAAECVENHGTPPDSLDIHGTWTVTAHVNDDNTVTITFTNGLLFFRTTTTCDDDATTANRAGWWTGAVAVGQDR